jgi:hypothetical protein
VISLAFSSDERLAQAEAWELLYAALSMTSAIRTSIEAARTDLAEAEIELEKAMRAIRVAPRAEKTTISELLEAAFLKLKAARATLGELEKMVTERGE